jgi:hypothetical protein
MEKKKEKRKLEGMKAQPTRRPINKHMDSQEALSLSMIAFHFSRAGRPACKAATPPRHPLLSALTDLPLPPPLSLPT